MYYIYPIFQYLYNNDVSFNIKYSVNIINIIKTKHENNS